MKLLVCGDLHTDTRPISLIHQHINEYDKVIFLGDYVDYWGANPVVNLTCFNMLIDFKRMFPDKVVLLIGNHDLSEGLGGRFMCSGYNYLLHIDFSRLFTQNLSNFQIAYEYKGILFTHAGVTDTWRKERELSKDPKKLCAGLNLELGTFRGFDQAGSVRGGFEVPSPVWADKNELVADPLKCVQIVGHTPVKTIEHIGTNYFCDTWSDYPDGTPIGDHSFLEIEDKNNKINIKTKRLTNEKISNQEGY